MKRDINLIREILLALEAESSMAPHLGYPMPPVK